MFDLHALGGLELHRSGAGAARTIPLQAKRLALLAYLTASPSHSFRRRDTILGLFWPDLDHEHARGALRQALHFLRKTLGDAVLLTRGSDEIGLDPSAFKSDAQRLEVALEAGDPEMALSLYRGDFLEGVYVADAAPELEHWIARERGRLRALAARAAWTASERPAGRGNTGEFVRRAVQLSGDDEAALRRGLGILDRRGDRAGAAALYEEFSRRVARDLEVEVSAETQAAMSAVRTRRPSAPDTPPPPMDPSVTGATPQEPPVIRAARPGRKILIAAAAGALLPLVIAYVGARWAGAPPGSPNLVAVFPFRVSDADSSLAWLHEGIVELLTIRLAGDGGYQLADPAMVLAHWDRRVATSRLDAPHDVVLGVAAQVEAARVIEGSITGSAQRITLTARLSAGSGPTVLARAVAEGSPDSVLQLVDHLAAELLGLSAGVEGARLTSLTSASLPAVRAFLAGQTAFRGGLMEAAAPYFLKATLLDSSFALAGLQLWRAAGWAGSRGLRQRGLRIAEAGRDRLSPADRALLDVGTEQWASAPEMFAGWNKAVAAYPNRPELWYGLGDAHFHWGSLAGEDGWAQRAADAFHRGWQLDSAAAGPSAVSGQPVAEPLGHMIELAQMRGDTAAVLHLSGRLLAVDSTSSFAQVLMWHRALVTSDLAREAFWDDSAHARQSKMMQIQIFVLWSGVGVVDLPRATAELARQLRAHDPGFEFLLTSIALNAGRPGDIPPERPASGYAAHKLLRTRLRRALSWDGDTTEAVAAARLLSQLADAPPVAGEGGRQQLYDICTLGEWRASRGDNAAAAAASTRLRTARTVSPTQVDSARLARYVSLCATLLDAMHASGLRLPEARDRVAAADSAAREFIFEVCCGGGEGVSDANLQLARLWEREGDLPRALRAVQRRSMLPGYGSTHLREEGRLAALIGDTARAVHAYRQYLAMRPNPEPSVRPKVEQVRRELAVLEPR